MSQATLTSMLQGLLDRYNAGDPLAKKELIAQAYGRFLLIARKLLKTFDRARVEEETAGVANEAYLRLNAAFDELKPAKVRQFLGLVALETRRVLLDRIRALQGRGKVKRPTKQGELQDVDAVSKTTRPEVAVDLLEAIGKLPEEEREVVDLLFLNSYSQAEAAELLGVHDDTIKRRWARARVKLAGVLADYDLTV